MSYRVTRALFISVSMFALSLPAVLAQQEQADPKSQPPDPTAKQTLDKEQKKKIKKTLKELDTPYKQWLNEDVVYIISPEERQCLSATRDQRRARTIHRAILAAPQRQSGLARQRV